MKQSRRFTPAILIVAAAIAGCSAPPIAQAPKASTPAATPVSCTERSAAARPPKNPIVELAWCIAETDNLYDPDHLFHETLGLKDYGTAEVPWGTRAFAGDKREQFDHLPVGILGFEYTRKSPEAHQAYGDRYFSFELDPKKACVRMEDIFATFGQDFRLSQVPISVPSPASNPVPNSTEQIERNPYGISYRTPALFRSDSRGSVNFDFRHETCLLHVDLQRSVGLPKH